MANISWRTGTKGKLGSLCCRPCALPTDHRSGSRTRRINICQGSKLGSSANTGFGRAEIYLANLPAKTDLRTLAATIKARWVCEQAHQQLKEELGLDHFEGRSWQGLHRHALMTMIAYAFLQYRRLATARRKKKNQRPTAPANSARRTSRHSRALGSTASTAMPTLPKMAIWRAAA